MVYLFDGCVVQMGADAYGALGDHDAARVAGVADDLGGGDGGGVYFQNGEFNRFANLCHLDAGFGLTHACVGRQWNHIACRHCSFQPPGAIVVCE